jgi:hypothetical protein
MPVKIQKEKIDIDVLYRQPLLSLQERKQNKNKLSVTVHEN